MFQGLARRDTSIQVEGAQALAQHRAGPSRGAPRSDRKRWLVAAVFALTPGLAAQSAGDSAPTPIQVDDGFSEFVDATFQAQLAQFDIPGAVFGLVEAKHVVLKGFGVADLATQAPAHPQRTLFHVASLTKALTAVAVLQLVEQGRLALYADVNRWLDGWSLTPPGGGVVTLDQLLTHTAGFDDRNIGRACRAWSEAPELGALLRRTAPPFAFAPGEVCSYSNWGFTLVGHVLERASGQSLQDYVAEHVFAPLGMQHSTLRLPDEWRAQMATGYEWKDGENVPEPLFRDVGGGAAMWSTTAEDYCRFLAALLNGGALGEARILAPESVASLLEQHFTHDARLAGSAYGFFERFQNGHRILEHSGGWPGFVSEVCLLPDDHLGFFFSLNSGAGSGARLAILEALLDKWLGAPAPSTAAELPGPVDPRLLGTWRSTVVSRATLEKVMSTFAGFELGRGDDGRLRLWNEPLRQVAPDCFEPVDGRLYLAPGPVVFDLSHDPARFYLGRNSYERVPWFESARVQLVALGAFAGVFLLAALGWPLGAWLGLRRARPVDPRVRRARRWAWSASVGNLLLLVGAGLALRNAGGANGGEFAYGVPLGVRILLLLPFATAALALASMVASVRVWRASIGSRASRWQLGLVTLACGLFVPWLGLWNLLGWRW